jgi:small subunit ribosomal protein S6
VNLYESTFIINPQADDATIDRQVKAVTDLITANSGKILREDRLGTRRLAYEIKGLTQGYYTSVVFEAPPETPSVLNRHFRLEEPYLRYLTVLFEGSLEGEKVDDALLAEHAEGESEPDAAPSVPEIATSERTETEPETTVDNAVEPVAGPEESAPVEAEHIDTLSSDETKAPAESQGVSPEQERPVEEPLESAVDDEEEL